MKIKNLLIIATLTLLYTSCGDKTKKLNEGTPEAVVTNYYNAIANKDFNKAAEYCDEQTAGIITMMSGMADQMPEDEEVPKLGKVECDVDGDKAKCNCKDVDGNDLEPVDVKKVGDDWKVTINKDGMGEDMDMNLDDINLDEFNEEMDGAIEDLNNSLDSITNELEENVEEVKQAVDNL